MLCVHAAAGFRSAGVPDFWRDMYWATKIAHGEAFPLTGPPIYGLVELGPWWFYLLALPIGLTGSVAIASAFVQVLAGAKYLLAWRLGTRFADARLGLAFACSLAFAGWSTIPLMFPSHTALVETMLLLLAAATWRCWDRLSIGNALLFGLAAGACVHAHPTTASYVCVAGVALLVRHRSWSATGRLAMAAAVVLLMLAPPWFDMTTGIAHRSVDAYVGTDIAVGVAHRFPALAESALVGGAWNGFLLMTTWNAEHARMAWFAYCVCVLVALIGLPFAWRRDAALRRGLVAAAALFVLQTALLVVLRPITPMWMLSTLLPPLAIVLAIGWYGWLGADAAWRRRCAGVVLAIFAALSVIPFALFLRDLRSMRVAPGVNPYDNAIESSDRYVAVAVPQWPAYRVGEIAESLCDAEVLHARLAWTIEQSLAIPARLACGAWPALRYAGRQGAGHHIAGIAEPAAIASGIEPDRVVAGMALYESRVTPIAPTSGGKPTRLVRDQIHPDHSANAFGPIVVEFDANGADVAVLTNRFPLVMPMKVRAVSADGIAMSALYDDGGSTVYRCMVCAQDASVHWRFELDAIEDDLDLIVLRAK